MSLKLKLKPMERIIVNGCVMRNSTKRRIEIEIENHSDVLRGSEMLDSESANTPVKRICYLVQIALVSRHHRPDVLVDIKTRIAELREVMKGSHGAAIDQIMNLVDTGEFYMANRRLQDIVNYEAVLLGYPQAGVFLASARREDEASRITEHVS